MRWPSRAANRPHRSRRSVAFGPLLVAALAGFATTAGGPAPAAETAAAETAAAETAAPGAAAADGRPHILWITSEDNGAGWLGCYGNAQASTPRLDAFAAEGVLYRRAFANAPVCAVARSVILTGVHAICQGTQHMRSRYPIPPSFRPYVSYLREAGYYCTNNEKTDYNVRGDDRAPWDACSRTAHYRDRPAGRPFFAVFNLTETHESSLFDPPERPSAAAPQELAVAPEAVDVPPLLPDLPEIRADIAAYHARVAAMDRRAGALLDELASSGLSDDTIVFYYADHGGVLPRSKRYLYDTGVQVPLLVRVPAKHRGATDHPPGSQTDELVSFVDFAPTALALAGLPQPEAMQGRAFLGASRQPADPQAAVLLYADRFDETYRHERALSDGARKYIHNFAPHLPRSPQNGYPFGMRSWRTLQQLAAEHRLAPRFDALWQSPQPAREFYDLAADPWELAPASPAEAPWADALRGRLRRTLLDLRDAGFLPEPFWPELIASGTVYDYLRGPSLPWERLVDLALAASEAGPDDLPTFTPLLDDPHPAMRYWALYGVLAARVHAPPPARLAGAAADRVRRLLGDPHAANRITAAQVLLREDRADSAANAVLRTAALTDPEGPAATLACHVLHQLDAAAQLSSEELQGVLERAPDSYAARWARRFLAARPSGR
jgi:arylsulfatase A-like enzyme